MARFVQLQQLIRDVRLDLGDDPSATKGRFTDQVIARALNRVQNVLWHSYEWPFRLRQWHVPLQKGQRTYELPEQVDVDGVSEILVRWNDNYLPVSYGYSNVLWNAYDANANKDVPPNTTQPVIQSDESDPVQYYRLHEPVEGRTRTLLEVWPTPATNGTITTDATANFPVPDRSVEDDSVQFDGNNQLVIRAGRRLPVMLRDQDTCYIDSEVLIAFTVAELAIRRELPDAQMRMQYAQEMIKRIRATGSKMEGFSLSNRARKSGGTPREKFGPRFKGTP